MGRPKGSLNRATREARGISQELLQSPEYRDSLTRRIKAGLLPAAVETMLWYYAYGKPTESHSVTVNNADELRDLTDAQLAHRAAEVSKAILEKKDPPATTEGTVH